MFVLVVQLTVFCVLMLQIALNVMLTSTWLTDLVALIVLLDIISILFLIVVFYVCLLVFNAPIGLIVRVVRLVSL